MAPSAKDDVLTACRVEFKKNGLISVQFNKDIEGLSVKQLQKSFDMMWREYRRKMREKIHERHRKQREERLAREEEERKEREAAEHQAKIREFEKAKARAAELKKELSTPKQSSGAKATETET